MPEKEEIEVKNVFGELIQKERVYHLNLGGLAPAQAIIKVKNLKQDDFGQGSMRVVGTVIVLSKLAGLLRSWRARGP